MEKYLSVKKIDGKTVRLFQGDLTLREVDAIVNAANSRLQHGGGVAGAIVRRGGDIIQEESNRIGFVSVGEAAITTGGKLKAKFVIHTVGPRMGEGDEDEKLRSAVISSLALAEGNGLKSISFPAVSAGIFGFPMDGCAEILVAEAAQYLRKSKGSIEIVEFCVFGDEAAGHFMKAMENL